MRTRSLAAWPILLPLVMLAGVGCHPGDVNNIQELDVVATFYEESAPFGTYLSYAMEDTIYNLKVLEDPAEDDDLDRRHDDEIIQQIKDEMARLGYALVDTGTTEDLRLGLGAVRAQGSAYWLSYPWWGYSPGYWWPSWNSVDFETGSLQIFLADWKNRDEAAGEIDPIWSANANGVLDSSTNADRLSGLISQAFAQSAYLAAAPSPTTSEVK
jgi:hypothetical protein